MTAIGLTSAMANYSATVTQRGRDAAGKRAPLILLVAAGLTLLLPEDASFYIGDMRLTPARFLFLLSSPMVFAAAFRAMSSRSYKFVASDLFVFLMGFWMILAAWEVGGQFHDIIGSGVIVLDFLIPYLMCRFLLKERGQAISLCHALACYIAIVGVLGAFDVFAGRYVTHDFFAAITGYAKGWRTDNTARYGLLRGQGTLEHPILLGAMGTIGLLIALVHRSRARPLLLGGSTVALLASISAAPLSGGVAALVGFMYRKRTPAFEGRWRLLGGLVAAVLIPFFLLHPRPFGTLITHLTMDQQNSYYRLLVWQTAGPLVLDSPMFGIGMTDDWPRPDWMPETVDSLWLRSAMSFGIPGAALIFLCMIGPLFRRVDTRTANLSPEERGLAWALSASLIVLVYLGFTVHFWGIAWIVIGFITGIRAHLGALACQPVRPAYPQIRPGVSPRPP